MHGVFLLLAALLFANLMNSIPLACLAAVLIVVGFKLTKPAIFRDMWRQGLDQFIPFLITYLGVIFSDLLKGVFIGLIGAIYFVIRCNQHRAFTLVNEGSDYMLRFNKDTSFTTKATLRKTLDNIPDNANVFISGNDANVIDHDIIDMIKDFTENGKYRGVTVELSEVEGKTWSLQTKRAKAQILKEKAYGES